MLTGAQVWYKGYKGPGADQAIVWQSMLKLFLAMLLLMSVVLLFTLVDIPQLYTAFIEAIQDMVSEDSPARLQPALSQHFETPPRLVFADCSQNTTNKHTRPSFTPSRPETFADVVNGWTMQGAWGPIVAGFAWIPVCLFFIPGLILSLATGFAFVTPQGICRCVSDF